MAKFKAARTMEFDKNTNETDAEIAFRIEERFDVLADLAKAITTGEARSLIVSGPAGLGKSYTIESTLQDYDPTESVFHIVKGYVRPVGMYKLLWQYRHPGNVLVFDDADSVFYDEVGLNLIKASCDTIDRRVISYLSEYVMEDEDGGAIPKSFEFQGGLVFITNISLDKEIDRGSKMSPHYEALISRSHYVDLKMHTRRDYMIRIKGIVAGGMLRDHGCTPEQEADVMTFIETHFSDVRELSLRSALKVASLRKANPAKWERMARITMLR